MITGKTRVFCNYQPSLDGSKLLLLLFLWLYLALDYEHGHLYANAHTKIIYIHMPIITKSVVMEYANGSVNYDLVSLLVPVLDLQVQDFESVL